MVSHVEEITDRRPSATLHADVLVAGAGASGLATAVTAARQGSKVIVVERYGFCGGGAVAGMSGTICGLYEASDNLVRPTQVVHGFVDDFLKAMKDRGGLGDAILYGKTYTHVHDPLVWREVADHLLQIAGVQVIYHAVVTDVLMNGDHVEGVQVYTKEGKLRIHASVTVDCTGDADVASMAGLPTFMGDDGQVQNPTMMFRLQGVDVERFRAHHGENTILSKAVSEQIAAADGNGYNLPRKKIWLFPTTRPGELLCNCTRITGLDGRELNAVFYRDFTEAEVEGRKQAREYARFFRKNLPGCENSWINDTGVQVCVRQTRQVEGRDKLFNADVVEGRKRPDGIARSPWPIELHAGEQPRVEWLLNDYYEVPLGCFVPVRGSGLLVAGRCLSAEHEAVASARVTAQCFSYGHAVGHAAALASREGIPTHALSGEDIRGLLNRDGAALD